MASSRGYLRGGMHSVCDINTQHSGEHFEVDTAGWEFVPAVISAWPVDGLWAQAQSVKSLNQRVVVRGWKKSIRPSERTCILELFLDYNSYHLTTRPISCNPLTNNFGN